MKSNCPIFFECPINGKCGNNWPKRKIPHYSLNFRLSGAPCRADYCNILFFARFRACLHEGGGPQVGEVTCLGGVKK